jgi:hypothetical protein
MSTTLGLVVLTYRRAELIERAADRVLASVHVGARRMSWHGDSFEAGGELSSIGKLGWDFFERGRDEAAFDLFLRGVAAVDAPEPVYRSLLESLVEVCGATRRPRAEATIRWYLRSLPKPPIRDARDRGRSDAIRGDAKAASRRFAEANFHAHAAIACESLAERDEARAHWTSVAARFCVAGEGDVASTSCEVQRALAQHHAARNDSFGRARDRAIGASLDAIDRAAARFEALDAPTHASSARDVRDELASPAPSEDRTRLPMLDGDHAHDAAEICASLLHDLSLERRLSPRGVAFVRRRALLARLLALEVERPSRSEATRVDLRVALAFRLGQVGDPRLLVPLEAMAIDDAQPVRDAATSALRELLGRS